MPAASLALFNTLSIILLIPVYDRGLVPLLRRFGTKLTLLSRIGEAFSAHGLHHACTPWTSCHQHYASPASQARHSACHTWFEVAVHEFHRGTLT